MLEQVMRCFVSTLQMETVSFLEASSSVTGADGVARREMSRHISSSLVFLHTLGEKTLEQSWTCNGAGFVP